ncbi:ATP-dependent transcriptional regulator [Longilinea arvoryzae]|uniref:ATP-dependent transcriptional regulator n=1 Tax=Longilinea arvoryzae TaxID=360412 RepID=A0A0S7BDQ9_9CHLR|nr:LuxR C-terminal-related transcriptional regulator [Longilinea arvoryzae]GAP13581.1 ATP-dependent transcriptional regulator [Longilinea arvoryzae]
MSAPILTTKLYLPPPRSRVVLRPRLIERLNEGLLESRKLTLISAPAGFGKSTLVSEWIASCGCPVAWLSLDDGDNDLTRFLVYFIAALQTISPTIGEGVLGSLQSPQPPSTGSILSTLINEISIVPDIFIFVFDDYHSIDSKPVDKALTFLIEHLPKQMRLVITTREDPDIPLARLRARGQLKELRAGDLRFTLEETAEFLNQVMDLNLSVEDVEALETRTEGWIAGLQLAALSMQGQSDATSFIKTFTGSHHFVLDYLMEEVLQQQTKSVQAFLLRTSILERLCGPLCDAVLLAPSGSGQETLKYLEHANLFIVPLDNERRWYRYHHLFADLLRQRLQQSASSSAGGDGMNVAELHSRASQWYEDHDLDIEAFQHAAAAGEVDHAVRLIEGKGIPLYHRGALVPILDWLESLPKPELDKRPALWLMYARVLTSSGQASGVEEKLQAAETALKDAELSVETRDIIGCIASNRATLAYTKYQPDEVIVQAQRALEYLSPDNLPTRTITTFTLGVGFMQKGNRPAAIQTFSDAISISQSTGHTFVTSLATMALGNMQIMQNNLYTAAETHRKALQLFGAQPLPIACESHLGLAQIYYEWNDLDAAEQHGLQALHLARQYERVIDRYILCEVFLARLKLAQGDVAGATAMLEATEQAVRQDNFEYRKPEVAAAQVLVLLRQGKQAAAAVLAGKYALPLSQTRIFLAQGETSKALALLESSRMQMEEKGWQDELLKVMVLQTIALQAHGEMEKAVQVLGEALALAEPGGNIRTFVDEGEAMRLLIEKRSHSRNHPQSGYADKLLAAFTQPVVAPKSARPGQAREIIHQKSDMIEPLSERELEVLKLLRSDLSGPEIARRLSVSINTFRTHTKNIFIKLRVNDRRAAIRRAEDLELF